MQDALQCSCQSLNVHLQIHRYQLEMLQDHQNYQLHHQTYYENRLHQKNEQIKDVLQWSFQSLNVHMQIRNNRPKRLQDHQTHLLHHQNHHKNRLHQ